MRDRSRPLVTCQPHLDHRRSARRDRGRFPDIERPVRVPFVPWVPILGILANLALITNLPVIGVVVGTVVVTTLIGVYLVWGGAPKTEELFERVVSPYSPEKVAERSTASGETSANPAPGESTTDEAEDRFRILVPIARPNRAPRHVRLAATVGRFYDDNPVIQVVNVTQIPDQTPSEMVVDTAEERASRIGDELAETNIDVEYTVEGHVSRDVGFGIVQTARDDQADLIVMGYPEESPTVAERVEYDAPCDVLYVNGFEHVDLDEVPVVNIGAGGGPHHQALLSFVNRMAEQGPTIHVINVTPTAGGGTAEDPEDTLNALTTTESVEVHNVDAGNVAEGLVSTAAENGGILVIGASRTRRLRQWVLGSTPDRVIDLAKDAGIPVIVYASETSTRGQVADFLFPVYRYFKKLRTSDHPRREPEASTRTGN